MWRQQDAPRALRFYDDGTYRLAEGLRPDDVGAWVDAGGAMTLTSWCSGRAVTQPYRLVSDTRLELGGAVYWREVPRGTVSIPLPPVPGNCP